MATRQFSKKNLDDFENDDLITIRRSQLRILIRETLEESLEKLRKNEMNGTSKEKDSNREYSRDNLESMSAAQVKKIAIQKAADEKVTIRVTGKSKIPTKQDNINFLLQETPLEEESPPREKHQSPENKTDKKKGKKKEAVYDDQKRIYILGKDAANEKGEVYGRILKSGKVRPFTSEERTELSKSNIPFVCKAGQKEVNKYRKECEKDVYLSSESSGYGSSPSILSDED
jgi:hypothetical protein